MLRCGPVIDYLEESARNAADVLATSQKKYETHVWVNGTTIVRLGGYGQAAVMIPTLLSRLYEIVTDLSS